MDRENYTNKYKSIKHKPYDQGWSQQIKDGFAAVSCKKKTVPI